MGRWHTRYVVTSPLKVFKSCYIIGCIFGVFAVVSGGHTVYSDKTLNRKKWKGVLIGALIQSAVLALVYVFCNVVDALPLGIILFVSHIIHIVLFGIFFGRKPKQEVDL